MAISTAGPAAGGRERILHEAYNKFIEFGFSAVSMQQIADAAGVNKATLYHHFRDKEDLFFEVVRLGLSRANARMAEALRSESGLRAKLLALAASLFGSERSDLNRLSGDMHQHIARERHATIWKDFQPPWSYLDAAIAEGIARGELAPVDPGVASRVCFSALIGQVQLAKFHDTPDPDECLAVQVVDLLLDGLKMR